MCSDQKGQQRKGEDCARSTPTPFKKSWELGAGRVDFRRLWAVHVSRTRLLCCGESGRWSAHGVCVKTKLQVGGAGSVSWFFCMGMGGHATRRPSKPGDAEDLKTEYGRQMARETHVETLYLQGRDGDVWVSVSQGLHNRATAAHRRASAQRGSLRPRPRPRARARARALPNDD